MYVRQIRQAGYLLLVCSAGLCSGCASLWQIEPPPVTHPPKVRVDASWFLENPSKDVVKRITDERQTHIETVLSSRKRGVISIPLSDAISGVPVASDQSAGSSKVSIPAESYSVTTEVNPEHSVEKSGSGGLMIKLNRGTNDVR